MNSAGTFLKRPIMGLPVWAWGLIIIAGAGVAWYMTRSWGKNASDQTSTNAGSVAANLPQNIDPLTGVPYDIESAINPNTGLPAYYGTGGGTGGAGGGTGGGGGSGGGAGGGGGDGNGGGTGGGGGGNLYPNGALFSFAEWQQEIKRYPGGIANHPHWMTLIANSSILTPSEKLMLGDMLGGGAHRGAGHGGLAAIGAGMSNQQATTQAMMAQPFGRNASGTPWEAINGIRR